MADFYPNLAKNINLQIQEAQWTPGRMNIHETAHRHVTVQVQNTGAEGCDNRFLKCQREKRAKLDFSI